MNEAALARRSLLGFKPQRRNPGEAAGMRRRGVGGELEFVIALGDLDFTSIAGMSRPIGRNRPGLGALREECVR